MSKVGSSVMRLTAQHASRINAIIAAATLITILVTTRIMWPISLLGFSFDPKTHRIESIERDSPAAQSGLQPGDTIIAMYDRPMAVVVRSNVFRFVKPPGSVAPIIVGRDSQRITAALQIPWPSFQFQATKVAFLMLALACWLAGYALGVLRQHDIHGSFLVSLFWFGISAVCGSLPLALYAAEPIMLVIQWLIPAFFVPFSIYIHTFFPPRPLATHRHRYPALIFGMAWLPLITLIVWAITTNQTMLQVEAVLEIVVPIEVICALGIVAWVLRRSYRETLVAHTRRQIKLIATACASVALIDTLLFVIPPIALGHQVVDPNWGIVTFVLVPLAYLMSGVTPDLYRLDRVVSRIFLHLLTTTMLATLLTIVEASLPVSRDIAIFLGVVAFVAIYQSVHGSLRTLTQRYFARSPIRPGIETALGALTQTLDASTLIATLARGVNEQFGQPAFAIYKGDIHGSNTLNLTIQQRMPNLPLTLPGGALTDAITRVRTVIDARVLHNGLEQARFTLDEQQIATYPAIALWCPIVHSQGYLLGLMVLGMRGDFDPYRQVDQQGVQRLMDAAALALANSAALAQQRESEEVIRGLYQRILHAHDLAARNIAAELHGDVINGVVMFNLYDLEELARDINDPSLKERISTVIDGERTLMSALRGICEQLHPTGIDDPLGLPGAIRTLLEKIERNSGDHCILEIHGTPLELSAAIQYEALRTIREAVNNAVKHAHATTITVHLWYPNEMGKIMTLEIMDDGMGDVRITPKPGHWGVRTIQESARAVHGNVEFVTEQGKGTCVRFTFPARYNSNENSSNQLETTGDTDSTNNLEATQHDTHASYNDHLQVMNTVTSNGNIARSTVTSDARQ